MKKKYLNDDFSVGALDSLASTIMQDIAEELRLGAITRSHVKFWVECDLRTRIMRGEAVVYVDIPEWDGTSGPKIITFADTPTLEKGIKLCLDCGKIGSTWEDEWVKKHVKK